MSIFTIRPRLQHADPNLNGGGGDAAAQAAAQAAAAAAQQQQAAANGEWLKPFGEHAKAFEGVKDAADLATRWTATNTELKTLKEKAPTFDWRKEIGGDDAEAQKVLARFADPKTFLKSFTDAQAKIRSGEITVKPLAADATPEHKAEYRKANGIPEKFENYFEKLPGGRVIGTDDKPLFDQVAQRLHNLNVPTPVMHDLVDWYYKGQEEQASAERELDKAESTKTQAALREEWGHDYQGNMNVLESWLDGLGGEVKANFKNALLGDGTRLMNNPEAVKWLVGQARSVNPAAGLLPAGGEGDIKSVQSEIDRIETVMKTNRAAYNKDEKMQEYLRKLYDARIKLAKK